MRKFCFLSLSLFVLIACCIFSGCTYLYDKGIIPANPNRQIDDPVIPSSDELEEYQLEISKNALSPLHVQADFAVKSGNLDVSIDNAHISRNLISSNVAVQNIVTDDAIASINDQDVSFLESYDENTGELSNGCAFVVLDITVKNTNAISLDASQPDIFRADALVWLFNMQNSLYRTEDSIMTICNSIDYFSERGANSTHPLMFQVAQGECISFEIGFFIGHPQDTYDDIFACLKSGGEYKDQKFIKLDFS